LGTHAKEAIEGLPEKYDPVVVGSKSAKALDLFNMREN